VSLTHLEQIDGLISHREGERLAWLASQVTDGVIVEIGSYTGLSACYLAAGASVTVFCVDLWDLGGQKHEAKYAPREVFDTFTERTAGLDVVAHRGASVEVAANWDQPVGLLFIDGLHTYNGVRSDIDAWTPHLTPDARVAFHDYDPHWRGVMRAVDEWVAGRPFTQTGRLVDL
jgi:MMP 1-O-methyltransferase